MTAKRAKLGLLTVVTLVFFAASAWMQTVSTRPHFALTEAGADPSEYQRALDIVLATDALSREFTVLNRLLAPVEPADVVSREFTVLNRESAQVMTTDVVSREFTVLNRSLTTIETTDVISREFTVLNRSLAPVPTTDVVSREFSVSNEAPPFLYFTDVVSREFTVYLPAPDLQITSLGVPAEVSPGDPFTVAYTVTNLGDAAANGAWVDRIYLSDDDVFGGDTLLDEIDFVGPLALGDDYSFASVYPLPATPGLYWIFVETDSDSQLDEAESEDNNRNSGGIDATGVEYTASVQANIDFGVAGTAVILSGEATFLDSGLPAPFIEATVRVRLQGTRRVFDVTSDSEGAFAMVFDPLPGEAGVYTVFADHPLVAEDPAQPEDTFTLFGMASQPDSQVLRLIPGDTLNGQVTLRNQGDALLSGITADVVGAPANLDVSVTPPTALGSLQSLPINYSIVAAPEVTSQGLVQVQLDSDQNAAETLSLFIEVAPEVPVLVATPSSLNAGMVRGAQTFVEFTVTNTGAVPSDALDVQLPDLPWLSLSSALPIAPLGVGESASLTLRLSPAIDLPLGPYTGNLIVSEPRAFVSVSYQFDAVSDAKGNLLVYATDEFTYWSPEQTPVEGAVATLRDVSTGAILATQTTDVDGFALFEDLTEAWYDLEVRAADHGSFRGTVLVPGGQTKTFETFLTRQLVNYSWSVFPTTIEDEYLITIDALFETHVPAPVVTIEPASVDLRLLTGETMEIDFVITNHGLITADDVRLIIGDHPQYEIEPLLTEFGDLPAQSTLVVPTVIRDKFYHSRATAEARGNPCVGIRFETEYSLVCGERRAYRVPVFFHIPDSNCGGGPGAGGFIFPQACDDCPPGIATGIPDFSEPIHCSDCSKPDCPLEIFSCFLGFTPLGCPLSLFQNCSGDITLANLKKCAIGAAKGCVVGAIPVVGQVLGPAVNLNDCINNIPCKCDCDPENPEYRNPNCPPERDGGFGPPAFDPFIEGAVDPLVLDVIQHRNRMGIILEALNKPFGDPDWFRAPTEQDTQVLGAWVSAFDDATDMGSDEDDRISEAERAQLLATPLPSHRTIADAEKLIDRWNRTLDYEAQGITSIKEVPAGMSTDFIPQDEMEFLVAAALDAEAADAAEGFNDMMAGTNAALAALATAKQPAYSGGYTTAGGRGAAPARDENAICARVRIEIEQEAVITRSAFRAIFELENSGDTDTLDFVTVTLFVKDEAGQDAAHLFGIPQPDVTGLPDLDGGGALPPGQSASAEWLIIPGNDAAPTEPVVYTVSGELSYDINGTLVTIPLYPAPITVYPNASLDLDYFLERLVFSDDPFTPETEPAVPFALGLIVENNGAGTASNLRITSAQPEIIENERGLLIDFSIIGTQVGSRSVSPSLSVSFGDIGPGATSVARWLLTSSLEGQFIEYNATFEHVTDLGDAALSLINSVDIFEMIHVVRVDVPTDDGLPDFLTNDTPDLERLADTIHSSDGAVLPVSAVLDGVIDGPPTSGDLDVELTATVPPGWVYIRLDEPSTNLFTILSVTRSDGKSLLLGDNVWTTHRIVRPEGEPSLPEDFLHIVDHDSTGSYTIVYEEFPDADSDEVPDAFDNCPNTPNHAQTNSDNDVLGDACDNCPQDDNQDQADGDHDDVGDICDNCLMEPNNDQADFDLDDVGDECDNCVSDQNNDQADGDGDQVGDVCDNCLVTPNTDQIDFDVDEVGDACDNCPCLANSNQTDDNGNSIGDACETTMAVVSSTPPSGAIDARQPSDLSGAVPFGWNVLEIRMNQDATALASADFVLTEEGGDGVAPGIADFTVLPPDVVRITLDDRIEPGTRLVVTHRASCTRTCVGYLPSDANQDGLATASDINALIDSINLVPGRVLPDYATDIDRSGVTNAQDILRLIDLLNGAGQFDVWLSARLPAPSLCD